MNPLRMTTFALAVSALCLTTGCGGSSSSGGDDNKNDPASRAQRMNDLKDIGVAYHSFSTNLNLAPAKVEDLAPHLAEKGRQRVIDRLKSGEIVFHYKVTLNQMISGEGTSNTVLAYEKIVPEKDGYVLMGDGSIHRMTAEEFKKATLGKPTDK